jgi:hypothetical protein
MIGRKLDTSTGAGGAVAVARNTFDTHLNGCADCQPHLCHQAEQLWRTVCLTALREEHKRQQANALADVVTAAPVVQGHPAGGAL